MRRWPMINGIQIHNLELDFKPLCGISAHSGLSRCTTIEVRLRLKRRKIAFPSMARTRFSQAGAFHCAWISRVSPLRTASHPPCTDTRRTNEVRARSKAHGMSYGLSESRSGTSREAATEEDGEISTVGTS